MSEIINVGKKMREEAYYRDGRGQRTPYKVSKRAIQEEISCLNALIESHMNSICQRLHAEGKQKTVLEEDIIRENGKIIRGLHEEKKGGDKVKKTKQSPG